MAGYEPGVCNIGQKERTRRFRVGLVGFAAAAAFTAWVVATGRPPTYLVGTFVLSTGGFLGYLQARLQFCVGFAAMAQYDLSGSGGDSGTVTEAELRKKDRRRAVELLVYATALGLATTLGVFVLFVSPLGPLSG